MLCAVGDLIEDVVVQLHDGIRRDSDTPATIVRRRGGSAANVAYFAAKLNGRARFIGCVGVDPLGDSLIAQLEQHHVDVRGERRGRTGSIVVVATSDGERTMLTDRGDATELSTHDDEWLADVTTLHVPMYSFSHEPISTATRNLVLAARQRNIRVSVDASSVTVIEQLGTSRVQHLLSSLQPDVLFCTRSEAAVIGVTQHEHFGAATVVVKDGPRPVQVFGNDGTASEFDVAAVDTVVDGTGAGDAFAAGYLLALARQATLGECVAQAQAVAARVVGRAGATLEDE